MIRSLAPPPPSLEPAVRWGIPGGQRRARKKVRYEPLSSEEMSMQNENASASLASISEVHVLTELGSCRGGCRHS